MMQKLYSYLLCSLIILSSAQVEAQSFTLQYATTTTNADTGLINVENGIASTVGAVTLKWKVSECNFPPDWLGASGFCDNKLCYDLHSLLPGGEKTSNPYNGLGTFHFGTNLTGAPSLGCHYVKVLMYNKDIPTDTATETYVICRGTLSAAPTVTRLNDNDIVLYPNPATDDIDVVMGTGAAIKSIAVYSVAGKMVSECTVSGSSARLNIANAPAGIYFVRLMNEAGNPIATKRFTKQ